MENSRFKFRVWDKRLKEWLYPGFCEVDGDGRWCDLPDNEDGSSRHNVEDLIRSDYTGLKDKNGKEIFEDDIITYVGSGTKVIVKVSYSNIYGGFIPMADPHYCYQISEHHEVIGNIYENPELLEGKNVG